MSSGNGFRNSLIASIARHDLVGPICYYHRGPLFFATYDPTGMLRISIDVFRFFL